MMCSQSIARLQPCKELSQDGRWLDDGVLSNSIRSGLRLQLYWRLGAGPGEAQAVNEGAYVYGVRHVYGSDVVALRSTTVYAPGNGFICSRIRHDT